jgi:[protein-PII] uridylyltransferase
MREDFSSYLRTFVESLPPQYRDRHDARAIADHARLAQRRTGPAVSGIFRASRAGGLPICVVADDAPGLLSRISAALVLSRLDVVRAEAYCRATSNGVEAVDLFWVRAVGAESDSGWIGPQDVARFQTTLVVLLDGTFHAESLIHELAGGNCERAANPAAVHFLSDGNSAISAVDIEADDRPGLLYMVSDALFRAGLMIARSEIATLRGRVVDRFYVRELDGQSVARRRVAAIRAAVLESLDPRGELTTPSAPPREVRSV